MTDKQQAEVYRKETHRWSRAYHKLEKDHRSALEALALMIPAAQNSVELWDEAYDCMDQPVKTKPIKRAIHVAQILISQ